MAHAKPNWLTMFYLLTAIAFSDRDLVTCSSSFKPQEEENPNPANDILPAPDALKHQADLLGRFEELVSNLSQIVSRLELLDTDFLDSHIRKVLAEMKVDVCKEFERKCKIMNSAIDAEHHKYGGMARQRSVSTMRFLPSWSDGFQFLSAVKLDSLVTCIHVLPHRDYRGFGKYIAVGDNQGRLFVFLRKGDPVLEFRTEDDSPVTAMLSYPSRVKNESVLVTGHKNGAILVHRVYQGFDEEESNSIFVEHLIKCSTTANVNSVVSVLEMHQIGKIRYLLSTTIAGEVHVYREDGVFHGSVSLSNKPLVFLKQRLLFLSEIGVGSLDLRNMMIKQLSCEGLNPEARVQAFVLDPTEKSKAYGFTSEGDLIHVTVLGDIMNFRCVVRSKKRIRHMEDDAPLALQSIGRYLLLANHHKLFAYNVSLRDHARFSGSNLLFSYNLDEIRSSFSSTPKDDSHPAHLGVPLFATDRIGLVIIGLGDGFFGIYQSDPPFLGAEKGYVFYTAPMLLLTLLSFAVLLLFAKKNEARASRKARGELVMVPATAQGSPTESATDELHANLVSRVHDILDSGTEDNSSTATRCDSPLEHHQLVASGPHASSFGSTVRPPMANHGQDTHHNIVDHKDRTVEPAVVHRRRDNMLVIRRPTSNTRN